jgi:aminopeptidase N
LIDAFRKTLTDERADKALIAQIMTIPTEVELGDRMERIDVDGIHEARERFMVTLARELQPEFLRTVESNRDTGPYTIDPPSMARRRLKNLALAYLAKTGENAAEEIFREFESATNMTDELNALTILADMDHPLKKEAVSRFYDKWKSDTLVLDKWFIVQAASTVTNTLENVVALCDHPDFSMKNPNKVRSLIGTFTQANPSHFHRKDGKGYEFAADRIIILDRLNTNIAARMASAFNRWKRYDTHRQGLMKQQLERIMNTENLSKAVYEIVSKALD